MSATADRKLVEMIRAQGHAHGPVIVREANRAGLPMALALALIEQESSEFANIFGCDLGPRNSAPFCHQPVTRQRVQQLIAHVKAGGISNGIGVTQLTSIDLIQKAEAFGGAHKVDAQCRVGFELMHGLISRHGDRIGIGAYNGGEGNPQMAYADSVIGRRATWQARINAALAGMGEKATSDAAIHRDLVLTTPNTKGPDIEQLQRATNHRARELSLEARLDPDGEYGPHTKRVCARVAFALGFSQADCDHIKTGTIDQSAQMRIRHPDKRSAADKKRATSRVPILKRRLTARKQGAAAAVRWARSKIGVHENPKDSNWGPQVKDWITFTGYGGPVFWCGCFVCYAVVEKGGAEVPTRVRLGLDTNIIHDAQAETNGFEGAISPSDARAGDIATFDFGQGRRHIALVVGPTKGGMIHTIDGNSSATDGTNPNGGEVAEHRRDVKFVTSVGRLRY